MSGFVPFGGFDGYLYQRTNRAAQQSLALSLETAATTAALDDFRARIATIDNAAALVENEGLLRTALEAFGLGDAKPEKSFVLAALTADPADEQAFLARFGDSAWRELNKTFGFGAFGLGRTGEPGFGDAIVARRRMIALDAAIGATDPSLRRALTFDRVVADLASVGFTDPRDAWRLALADDETRRVFQIALGLDARFQTAAPEARVQMAIDGWRRFDPAGTGLLSSLSDADARDDLLRRFFANDRSLGFAAAPAARPGLSGFLELDRARDTAQPLFDRAVRNDPDFRAFRAAIARVEDAVGVLSITQTAANAARADAFVKDDALMRFTLKAFGLGDRAPTAEFMRQVLLSDPDDADGFAARQGDARWVEIARAFGFGAEGGSRIATFGFAERFMDRAAVARFEEAASAGDATMRQALLGDRTLETLATADLSEDARWRRAMTNGATAFLLTEALGLTESLRGSAAEDRIAAVREAAEDRWGVRRFADFADGFARQSPLRDFFAARAGDETAPGGLAQPIIPIGGGAGWAFLQRTMDDQKASFLNGFSVRQEMAYFAANIGGVRTAQDLVDDRRLLAVALQAFGLQDELGKTGFVLRVLEGGTEARDAPANRIPDARWREMARAFGFGDGKGAQTGVEGFADAILLRHGDRAFEIAVGETDQTMRVALNFDRTAQELARAGLSERGVWFRLLGDPATRSFIETAFNLPREFAQIDVDQQVQTLIDRTRSAFGAGALDLADPELRARFTDRYFALDSIRSFNAAASAGQNALALLQAVGPVGGGGLLSARA
jgi:hypothetical protein